MNGHQITWVVIKEGEPKTGELETPKGKLTIKVWIVKRTPKAISSTYVERIDKNWSLKTRQHLSSTQEKPELRYHLQISFPENDSFVDEFQLIPPIHTIATWLRGLGLEIHTNELHLAILKLQSQALPPTT